MLQDTIKACRSYRRFRENERINHDLLVKWVDAARFASSARNAQALRYTVVSEPDACERVFSCLGWAAALRDWPGPAAGERPSAYIIMWRDAERSVGDREDAWDQGIAAQSIMLQAVEDGFAGCMIGNVKRRKLAEIFGIDEQRFRADLVLALGRPAEEVRIEPLAEGAPVTYWRDEAGVHHVPKRALEDVLLQP